jgi:hypothetical protein
MNGRGAVGKSGEPDPLPSHNMLAGSHVDPTQIGDRDLQTGHRLNGHGFHPGHRTCECDLPRRGCRDRVSVPGGKVDSPVAPVLADGSVLSDHRPRDGWADTDCCRKQKLEQGPTTLPTLPNLRAN